MMDAVVAPPRLFPCRVAWSLARRRRTHLRFIRTRVVARVNRLGVWQQGLSNDVEARLLVVLVHKSYCVLLLPLLVLAASVVGLSLLGRLT